MALVFFCLNSLQKAVPNFIENFQYNRGSLAATGENISSHLNVKQWPERLRGRERAVRSSERALIPDTDNPKDFSSDQRNEKELPRSDLMIEGLTANSLFGSYRHWRICFHGQEKTYRRIPNAFLQCV